MEYARTLLLHTDKSVEKIMEEIGYFDKKNFYKLFAEYYNETPGSYRNKHVE